MHQPWQAEQIVDATLATQLLREQFPELILSSLELLGQGWDNTVYRVNQQYVFRFPRRQLAVSLMETAANLLPKLAPRLPLPIPTPVFWGKPSASFAWPFFGFTMLPGTTGCAARLTLAQRTALAAPLAQFLHALHHISAQEAHALGAGPDTLERADVPRRWSKAVENIATIKQLGLATPATCDAITALLHSLKDVRSKGPTALVHGDMYARHLLITEQHMPSGIIDWDDVHIGDPAVDLQLLFGFFPPQAHALFLQHYGPMDEVTRDLALFRAIHHTAYVAVYSHSVGDKDLLDEGLVALGFIALQGL